MKKWGDLSEEERREWQDHPVTQAAVDWLRALRDHYQQSVVDVSSSHAVTLHEIGLASGMLTGVKSAIHRLTERKK